MYQLYHAWTPNVIKVMVGLEEMGLPYERIPLSTSEGQQFTPEYLAISPNNKVPALVDTTPPGGGAPFAIFESGAILIYLAERTGQFLPAEPLARSRVIQWLMWQMAGFGPMLGQAHQFLLFAPDKNPYGIRRYAKETQRLYGVLDRQLEGRDFICDDYSIADMAAWPWAIYHDLHGENLDDHPNVKAWFERIAGRPAVIRATDGMKIPDIKVDEATRAIIASEG